MRRLMVLVIDWLRAWVRPVSAPSPAVEDAERRRQANLARLQRLARERQARIRAMQIQQDVIQRRKPQPPT